MTPEPPGLRREQVARLVQRAEDAIVCDACRSCDCFQAFLTQLELDAAEDVGDLTGPRRVPRAAMHNCLGCDPCPPGAAYAAYLRCCPDAPDEPPQT